MSVATRRLAPKDESATVIASSEAPEKLHQELSERDANGMAHFLPGTSMRSERVGFTSGAIASRRATSP